MTLKNYAAINPSRGFEYTVTVIDEKASKVELRCFANRDGVEELMQAYTKMDSVLRRRIFINLSADRYVEYAGHLSGDRGVSMYISYLGDPNNSETLLDVLHKEVGCDYNESATVSEL